MIYRIIALQSLRLQKNRAIKKKNEIRTLGRKNKRDSPKLGTTDQDESPLVQGVVEISYNIQQQDNKHNLVVYSHHKS
jgi:hypothetical protein